MADLLKRLKISEQQYGVGMEDNPFQDVSNDEAMKVCFGGGGGKSPPPAPPQSVTQQTSNIPEYFQPYLERLFDRAEAVTTEPFQRYEGQRLAEFTPEQQAAYSGVGELVGDYKPYIASADLLTAQAAQQSTDPTAIAARMNPYQQAVIDIQKREALRDAEKLQQQIGAQAVGAGAYGGSRQALIESELARQQGQRLADIQAVGSQQAYDKAMEQLAADRAASLAAGQQFATLGGQQQQLGLAGLGALETVGGTRQAQQQKALDIAYEDFARETTRPSQQVQEMSSVLRGFNLPVSTYTTAQQQTQQPGLGQQLLGAGLGVYGLGSQFGLFKEGGIVDKFEGGKILEGQRRFAKTDLYGQFSSPYVANLVSETMKLPKDRRPKEVPERDMKGQDPFTNRDRMLYKQIVAFDEPIDKPFEKKEEQTVLNPFESERKKRKMEREIATYDPLENQRDKAFDVTKDYRTEGMPSIIESSPQSTQNLQANENFPESMADFVLAKPTAPEQPAAVGTTPEPPKNRLQSRIDAIMEGYKKSEAEGDEREKKGMARLPGDLIAQVGLNLMTGDPEAAPGFLSQVGAAVKPVLPEARRRKEREEEKQIRAEERREDLELKAMDLGLRQEESFRNYQNELRKIKLAESEAIREGKMDDRLLDLKDEELGLQRDAFNQSVTKDEKDFILKQQDNNIRSNLGRMDAILKQGAIDQDQTNILLKTKELVVKELNSYQEMAMTMGGDLYKDKIEELQRQSAAIDEQIKMRFGSDYTNISDSFNAMTKKVQNAISDYRLGR